MGHFLIDFYTIRLFVASGAAPCLMQNVRASLFTPRSSIHRYCPCFKHFGACQMLRQAKVSSSGCSLILNGNACEFYLSSHLFSQETEHIKTKSAFDDGSFEYTFFWLRCCSLVFSKFCREMLPYFIYTEHIWTVQRRFIM